jgi:transcriptional regulator with XRE-family HTH domain
MSSIAIKKKFFSISKCGKMHKYSKRNKSKEGKMQKIGKILKVIRELKKITTLQVAEKIGVHHSAIGAFELHGVGLGADKANMYADLLGVSIVENQVNFKKDMHIFYLPITPGLRLVRIESFFDFFETCKISPIQIVVFVDKKHVVAIAVKDLQNNVFVFLPRRGKYLAKTSALLQKLKEKFSEKIINIIENPFSDFEKIQKTDLEKYFVGIYCYSCPQLIVKAADGNIRCLPVVPIGAILEDLYRYLNYEKDPIRKEYTFLDLFHWLQKILQKTDEEISADLEKARKIWNF